MQALKYNRFPASRSFPCASVSRQSARARWCTISLTPASVSNFVASISSSAAFRFRRGFPSGAFTPTIGH